MTSLTTADLAPEAIAVERDKLAASRERLQTLEEQLAKLQQEVQQAKAEEAALARMVQWRELMAAVNENDAVYGVTERLLSAFRAFRESLVEPEDYQESQKEEGKRAEELVPYSDTDDYADFSNVETAVEDVLDTVKETLTANCADTLSHSSNRSSFTSCVVRSGKQRSASADSAQDEAANAARAATRRQALLQLLTLTVLTGKVEEHCGFDTIKDAADAPRSDVEEVRDGVTSVWQWMFHEHPGLLTAAERAEWTSIAADFLGHAYVAAP